MIYLKYTFPYAASKELFALEKAGLCPLHKDVEAFRPVRKRNILAYEATYTYR